MAVSGKTAAPHELPFYLGTDKPPDMAAVTKALAERTGVRLDAIAPKQIVGPTKKQLLIANASGVVTAVTASGDVTNDESGVFTIGGEKVGTTKLANDAVTAAKVDDGAITDGKLASPNNSVYRMLFATAGELRTGAAAATYILGPSVPNFTKIGLVVSGAAVVGSADGEILAQPNFIYFDDADYTVAGKTQKLRLRAQVAANATTPTITFTFGLYPITVAGGADALTMTLGTVVASSTVAIASPAASTVTSGVNADFTIPADGAYALGIVTSGKLTEKAAVSLSAQLQSRNV